MFKSTNEFDTAVYNLLIKIRDGDSPQEKPSDLDKDDFDDIIKYIANNDLAREFINQPKTGKYFFKTHSPIRLTREGLHFVENFKI